MKKLSLLYLIVLFVSLACKAQTYSEPFWNQKLSVEARTNDLLKRLTLDEKISLLYENSPGIPRLGIRAHWMGNEALHGVVRPGKFTVFPQAIGLAATWNTDLMYKVSTAISDEARGRWNELQQGKLQRDHHNDLLVFWSPDINLARDPRWGRTEETYGEDPFLASRFGVAFVRGMQGNDSNYLKVVATPKHYTANNVEFNRYGHNAVISEKALRDYYLVPFEYAVKEGKAESIMSAYNAVNGVPCTANKKLLTDILRKEWGFKGFVVSDCGAPGSVVFHHKYVSTVDSAAAACMNAGLDLECSGGCGDDCQVYQLFLKPALAKGMITEAQIDSAAARVLRARFKLGFFDRDLSTNPYNRISPSVVGSVAHTQLTLEAARQSVVLLKNKNHLLPLDKSKMKSVALFGPNVANCVFGGYSAKLSAHDPVSILQGLKNRMGEGVKINYVAWNDTTENGMSFITAKNFHLANSTTRGLTAEYYDNAKLEGKPKTRVDGWINFNASLQPPDPIVPLANKGIRWTGVLTPDYTGKYLISLNSDDGVRLYIDDKLVIDQWVDRSNMWDSVKLDLEAKRDYKFMLEYFDSGGDAICQLRWKTPHKNTAESYSREKEIAAKSDYVIVALGLNTSIESEGLDKKDIELVEEQDDFIREIVKSNPNTIVVIESGSPLAIDWINENIPSVVNAWYAGEQGGNAVADVLLGNYNPAGRLPLTYYKSTADLLPLDDYEISKGRTYMYYDKAPTYPFGFGLSYSQFEYSALQLSKPVLGLNDKLEVSVTVKNTGNYDGDEVVQLYIKNRASQQPQPKKALKGFKRISLKKGESKTVQLTLTPEDLRYFDAAKNAFVVEPGTYEVQVGASSEDIRVRGEISLNR